MSAKTGIPKVVVIGAGTIGCAITYYLAKIGADVTLVERNTIGSGNTSLAASLLTKIRSKPEIIPLVQETYRAISEIEQDIGTSLDLQQVGSLHVAASEASVSALNELMSIANDFGIDHAELTRLEMEKMVPWLKTDEILKASFMHGDAFMDAYVLANAFVVAAKKHGATVLQTTNVEELIVKGGEVKGIKTKTEDIASDFVVDAAGAWSNLLAKQAGIGLPMAPVRSNYWITSPNTKLFPRNQPIVILPDASAYTRPDAGALLFGLRESRSIHFDPRNLPEDLTGYVFGNPEDCWNILVEQSAGFKRFFPDLEEMEIQHYIAGVSTYTPDGMFVLGGVPGTGGFLAATGCSGAGVAVSGGMGRIISELVVGETTFCETEPFDIDRFGNIDPFAASFMQRCADARSVKKSG
ncbi:MAG: FAD-binding oxidoreductase [Cyclobacteriaceae bacterium]